MENSISPIQFKSAQSGTLNQIVILDPINPTNNVAWSTYRYGLVEQLFILCVEQLNEQCSYKLEILHERLKDNPNISSEQLFDEP